MAGINKVQLIGGLGRDPEIRYSQGGTAICKLSVATSRKWLDKQSNEYKEETEWHRVSVFGKQAENCDKYLSKGKQVYIEGRLKTSSYDDKDGKKCYSTEIVAEVVQFLSPIGEGKGQSRAPQQGGDHEDYSTSMPDDSELPF